AALRATHSATRLRGGRVVLDLAAPRAGLHATALDEVLEALQVALDPPVDHAQRIADLFLHPLGLVVHLHHDARLRIVQAMERDVAAIARAGRAGPCDALVRHLFGDARVPLLDLTADIGAPAHVLVVDLPHLLDTFHEVRERL